MVPSSLASWRQLPPAARLFIRAGCAVGACIIAYSAPVMAGPHAIGVIALVLAAVPASMVKANFPDGLSTLTLCLVLDYVTLLMLGPQPAVLVAAVGAWGQCTFRNRIRNPLHQTLFSISALVCAVLAAGFMYIALGGRPGVWEPATMFVPLAAATTTFFLLNSGLIAAAIGLSTGQSPARIWSDSFLWIWPSYLLGAAVSVAIFSGVRQGSLWLVAYLLVPLALTVRNLQVYFERLQQSQTDPLTGLPNQRFVLEHAARELARARRRGTPVALALVDIDGFKTINDTYGHRAGDGALSRAARCLQQSVRPFDICARFGGDEFLLVLPGCDLDAAVRRRDTLRDAVEAMRLRLRGADVTLSISVGIAVSPDDGESLDQLLDLADARMYEGKTQPRPRPSCAPARPPVVTAGLIVTHPV